MAATVPALSEAGAALCIFLILLVPLAIGGLALINTGFVRSRSAAHAMLSTLCVGRGRRHRLFRVSVLPWRDMPAGRCTRSASRGKPWNWLGAEKLFFRGLEFDVSPASLAALLQIFGVGLAAAIPLGSAVDRWRLGASAASAALLAGCIYPLFAHWAWGGGWLAQLGANYSLGRGFLDCGGAGCNSGRGRAERLGDVVDSGSSPGQILGRRHSRRNSRTQQRAGSVWLPVGVAGMGGTEFGGRNSVCRQRASAGGAHRGEHNFVGLALGVDVPCSSRAFVSANRTLRWSPTGGSADWSRVAPAAHSSRRWRRC